MKVIFWLSVMADVKRQHAFLPYLSRQKKKITLRESSILVGKYPCVGWVFFRWICEAYCWNVLVNSTRYFSKYAVVQPLMDKRQKQLCFHW